MQRVGLTSHSGKRRWIGRECWDTIFFFFFLNMLGHSGLVKGLKNVRGDVRGDVE